MTHEDIQCAAVRWLIELDNIGNASVVWPAVHAWLAKDISGRIAFIKAKRIWQYLDAVDGAALQPPRTLELVRWLTRLQTGHQ